MDDEIHIDNESSLDWKSSVGNMLRELEAEYELPHDSLWISDNISKKNPSQIISHMVSIWEPDYPYGGDVREMNKIVLTINISTVQSRLDDLDLCIREAQYRALEDKVPSDAIVLEQTSTDKESRTVKIRFNKHSEALTAFIREHVVYCIENYESKSASFGCCDKYEKCSDALKCIHVNRLYAKGCTYRKNLEQGRIFYGKNRNTE